MDQHSSSPLRIERLPAVPAGVGFGRSFFCKPVALGDLPATADIGRASGWDSRSIDARIMARTDEAIALPDQKRSV